MFYSFILISLLINLISTENKCSLLNNKLNKYGLQINNQEKDFLGIRLCQGLINDHCCPLIYEEKIQNATAIELYHLLELYTINLYQPLLRLTIELNNTISKLIQSSRNETHWLFQHSYRTFYNAYQPSIDLFYNNLLRISSRNDQHDIKNNIEDLLRSILRITIELTNTNKEAILPMYFLCLWRNQPFGNRINLIANRLEINLGKIFRLNELLKLSIELVQVMSTSVTTDYHCIDSYMQLAYCNLCSGRKELPCLANCADIIESCLVNITLINDVWNIFIDSLENVAYFNGIEKGLSSMGISISDTLMTFFNSDGIENKDIIDQCGAIDLRKDIFDNDQKFHEQYTNSLSSSLLDQQLLSIRQSLEIYRSFWLMLPKQICQSDAISASNEKECWTGTAISQNEREVNRINYDKPLSLRLQWILKEMKEKAHIIGYSQRTTTNKNSLLINEFKLNLTDDYPYDNEFDYSDYAYEDSIDEFTSSTTTTTISSITQQPSTMSVDNEISIDDTNTVSYYDYGEQDVVDIDDELDKTSTQQIVSILPTTSARIPSYHQRQPVIWNINIDEDDYDQPIKQYNSSSSLNSSFLLLLLFIIIFLLT